MIARGTPNTVPYMTARVSTRIGTRVNLYVINLLTINMNIRVSGWSVGVCGERV